MAVLKYWDGTAWVPVPANPPAPQPRVELDYTNATPLPLPNATHVIIPWDTEMSDIYGMHDNAVNPTRVTIPSGLDGVWLVTASLWYASNATNARYTRILKNGIAIWEEIRAGTAGGVATIVTMSVPLVLVAGDYIEFSAYQNSTSALTVPAGTPSLMMVRMST